MLRNLKRFGFNPTELSIIYKGYVRPLLEYGDVVWGSSLGRMRTPVQEAFSYGIRHEIRHIHCDSMKYDLMLH